MITDDELAAHPDPRVHPGICGAIITHTAAGVPLAIERICIKEPHGTAYQRRATDARHQGIAFDTGAHPERHDGIQAPPSDRHFLVRRYPNRGETPDYEPPATS